MKQNTKILKAWNKTNELLIESNKLFNEGNKLLDKEYELSKGYTLRAETNKLLVEANKLLAKGRLIFINAVIKEYGNIELKWKANSCILENGERYFYKNTKGSEKDKN